MSVPFVDLLGRIGLRRGAKKILHFRRIMPLEQ